MSASPLSSIVNTDQIREQRFRDRSRDDAGNAERLLDRHGENLRYSPGLGWLIWDGRRWRPDNSEQVVQLMIDTVRALQTSAAKVKNVEAAASLGHWAAKSLSRSKLTGAIALAQSHRSVVVDADELDDNEWLLNVENGTINLHTGALQPHSRDDLITRLCPVEYRPDARAKEWDGFVERVTGGSPELAKFLQRAVGYTLTGHTFEQVLFFAHGPAATGKSTLLEAVRAVLGDYAVAANFETFLRRRGEGVRNDIARLAGARLVVAVEVDEGRQLDAGLLKQLTGGDRMAARFLHREHFEFTPRFKLWLVGNHRPAANAADEAIWRRIVQIPFLAAIPEAERSTELQHRLRTERSLKEAVLTWAVAGAGEWRTNGRLRIPDQVKAYTTAYRRENDPLHDFLEETCVTGDASLRTPARDLYSAYRAFAGTAGDEVITQTAFGKLLADRGFESGRTGAGRFWKSVGLKDQAVNP